MKKILIFIVFFALINTSVFAGDDGSGASIKDLTSTIKILEEKQDELNLSENLQNEYQELQLFLKSSITGEELDVLNKNLKDYITYSQESEQKIQTNPNDSTYVEDIKNKVLQKRLELYKYIYQYVDQSKQTIFIDYVKQNIISSKEKKDLLEDLSKQQILLDEKVKNLQEKIQDHKESLNSSIDDLITSKIIERINQIDSNEKYNSISIETKNKIYQSYIDALELKLQEIDNSTLSENYKELRKKIIIKIIDEITNKINQ